MKSRWVLIALTILLASCSTLFKRSNSKEPAKLEVKDVPFEARAQDEGMRSRLLVLPFLDEKLDRSLRVAEEARQTVVRDLLQTREFVVIRNEDFPQNPKNYITEEREYDLNAVSRVASGLGVAGIIEGKILDIRAKRVGDAMGLIRSLKARIDADVRIRVYAGRNGKEILNEVRSATVEASSTRFAENSYSDRALGEDPELIRQAIRKAFAGVIPSIARAMEKMSWEGRVALISGERLFINAGRLSGLQIGDILKVTEDGEEVYDPQTGRFIGTAPGRMKGTIEVVSYFGKDGAISIVHSGSGFKENDRVELY